MPEAVVPQSDPRQVLETLRQPQVWKEINPSLTVCATTQPDVIEIDEATGNALEQLLLQEGYFHVPRMPWGLPIEEMARAIVRLGERGFGPPFCFMYDEFWLLFARLDRILRRLLGGDYRILPAFWAWHVDPRASQSGWNPHRDRGSRSLFPDRRPRSLTIWVPLTAATTLNGCMYLVPADRDPTYGTEEEKQYRFAWQDIRALPGTAGDLFCWTQAVLHWGSHSSPRAAGPRISVSFEFQRADLPPFEHPLIPPLRLLPLEERLKLICRQVLQYRHMYPLSPELEALAKAGVALPEDRVATAA